MALVTPVFFDTSVLIAGLIETGPASASAQRVLDAVAAGRVPSARTAWHCCLEFYAVSTRLPEEFRLSPRDAARLIREEILARFDVLQLPPASRVPFLQAAEAVPAVGGRIYDAHLAEIARQSACKQVVTENLRDFLWLTRHGILVSNAEEFVKRLP